jgi:hypothetical protein
MSWLFSQVLVEEFLEAICLDGEQSVPLNGNSTPQAYCAPDKMTGFSRLSPFGITYAPLTESRGGELLTLYLAGFHAKTSQPQGGGLELTENEAECGEKWQGSFVKFNPDLCLWKTHQFSLLGDLDEFLETWPKWGLMRNGECWAQTALDYPIGENEFGCWLPTPVTSMWRGAAKKRYWGSQEYRASFTTEWVRTSLDCAQYYHPDFVELIMDFPDKWTELKPLEMHKYQEWRQLPGES